MTPRVVVTDHAFGGLDQEQATAKRFRKPHPGHLLEVLRRMGAGPERALFVGDTAHDSDCARAAHVECVLVDWAARRSGEAPAPRRVQRFAELVELVDERNGSVPAATA